MKISLIARYLSCACASRISGGVQLGHIVVGVPSRDATRRERTGRNTSDAHIRVSGGPSYYSGTSRYAEVVDITRTFVGQEKSEAGRLRDR